jgi:hypothetical protein
MARHTEIVTTGNQSELINLLLYTLDEVLHNAVSGLFIHHSLFAYFHIVDHVRLINANTKDSHRLRDEVAIFSESL